MPGVSQTIIFDSPIESVFGVIIDYAKYPDFVDGVDGIEILESDESGARVQYSLNLIKKFTYIIKLTHERPNRVSWSFESGDIFKKNEGSWTLTKIDDNNTEVCYELDLDVKVFAPKMIVKKLTEKSLPTMLDSYKERARNYGL